METKSIGFIGGGRITKIFLHALSNKQCDLRSVIISDSDQKVLNLLKEQFKEIQITEKNIMVARQEVIIFALHPPQIMAVLDEIKNEVSPQTLLLSLAPKIPIKAFQSKLNLDNVARLIPNATSFINEGFNPVCFSENFNEQGRINMINWLTKLGDIVEVDEKKLEAYAIVSAMAPTYFWFQWNKLIELGKEFGMEADEANQAVYRSLTGALNLQFNDHLSYEEMIDLIPVKPISEHEEDIKLIFEKKLKSLFEKISPVS